MKYFLLAGEASGDLHASNLMREITSVDADSHFVGLGGDMMRAAGCHLFQDYRQMAFMGFVDVIANLGKVGRNMQIAKNALLQERPDALILIDYPSFNLRIAAFCKKHLPNTKIFYYIPPKVWAWKRFRVHKIAQLSNCVMGIFPFEETFYQSFGYQCTYVGNPTMDSIRYFKQQSQESVFANKEPYIAILPGSRPSEISHCLPTMIQAARKALQTTGKKDNIYIAGAPGISPDFYQHIARDYPIVFAQTYDMLAHAEAAIVNSGTATLEAALLGCPEVAVYYVAGSQIMRLIWKMMFTIRHFTLPNIIANREVIKEKIAHLFTVDEVASELIQLLSNPTYRQQMQDSFAQIAQRLGDVPAAKNAAKMICNQLNSPTNNQ